MKLQSLIQFNDSVFVMYCIVMLFFVFSPVLFFSERGEFFSSIALTYLVCVSLVKVKKPRVDISKNLIWYFVLGFISFSLFQIIVMPGTSYGEGPAFTSIFSKLLYVVVVIALSESYIRQGLLHRIKNPIITNLIMGFLHVGSYMAMMGEYSFTSELVVTLLITSMAFFVFQLICQKFDIMSEAIVHGMYNLPFY